MQDIPLAPVPSAPKMTIDGKLDEWKAIPGYVYDPLSSVVKSGGDPVIAALLTNSVSVNLKTCYDSDALYISADWRDRKPGKNRTPAGDAQHWDSGGEGFELHLRTDRVLHLACWPIRDGRKLAVMARYDDQASWQDISKIATVAAAVTGTDGRGYAQELRLPWSAITATGKLPADGRIEVGVDFAWNAIPPSLVGNVRRAVLATEGRTRGISACFLTARPGPIADNYLPSPSDWGTLAFGGTSQGDQANKLPDGGTSLSSFPVAVAKTPPSLDGGLAGWTDSYFQTSSYLGGLWGDRYTCRIAAQYDADNLYIAAHFPNPGPSNLKAESTTQGFAGGDALQMRLANGARKINLCAWFDSAAKKPALTADQNDLSSPFLLQQGAKEGFKPDGRGGYVQTLALPWSVLFGGAPTSTDQIKATFQLWFADLTPRFSVHAKTTLEKRPVLSVAYTMPADGQATVGLYDKEGKLLRWVAQDVFRKKGENLEPWDGLDQWGKPVAAGSFALKGIYHPPLSTEYKMSVDNPGTPPWSTPDDKGDWLGDEANPQAAATDGRWVFLAAPVSEKGYSILAVDETGQRQWGAKIPCAPRCVSLAVEGDYVYALYSGPETTNTSRIFLGKNTAIDRAFLICLNKRTGKPARFTIKDPQLKVATWPYREEIAWLRDLRNNKSFSPATYGGQPRYSATDVGESTSALGVAAVGGKVYISLLYDNKLLELDAATGKPTGETIPVTAPAGLHRLDDHTLLAVSGKQIVKVDLATKKIAPFVTSGLVAPFGVTADKAGATYVSDWGSSFQVKVFGPDGHLIRAIGKEGGRPWVGKWDANGMLVPRGIAVTDEGKLWVAEDDGSPKRVSVWNTTTGALIKDYIGPSNYGGGTYFWVDPHDSTQLYTAAARFKIDLDKKTAVPEAIVFRSQNRDDPFIPTGGGSAWGHSEALYHGGHEYVAVNTSPGIFTILQRHGDIFRAVAAIGNVHKDSNPAFNIDGTEADAWDSDLGHHAYKGYFPECFSGHGGDNYSWTDTNGDNLVQPEEMHWVKPVNAPYQEGSQPRLQLMWGTALASDWSFFTAGDFRDKSAIYRLKPRGWTEAGAPIYDMADAKPIAFDIPGARIESLYATKDNRLIACYNYEGYAKSSDSIACYDFDGHRLWSMAQPKRLEGKQIHATSAVGEFNIPKLGTVVGTWAWHGAVRPYLFTTDGLYVGTLLENTLLGPTALWGESYNYYYQTAYGTPYLVNGGWQAEHILQVKGLEGGSVGRFEGSYQLSEADAQKAAQMREMPEQKVAPKPVLAVTWLGKTPAIDGDLSDWNLGAGVSLDGGNGRTAEIALGRDANWLYLAYKVHERNPMRNGGSDWRTLFTTGDCIDLMLQTDPKADVNRRNSAAGDERLLVSMFQDKPIAVLYRPVVPGAKAPVRLSSASIDEVTRLDSARVAIKRDEEHGFYTVEVAVPLKELGIDSKASGDLRGDVGVVFADDSGKSRSLRLYYYNHHTEMVNDRPTEATLQPLEWGTLAMPLGVNLLKNGGFENPFVDSSADKDKGWFVSVAENGSDAALVPYSPYSGHRSLLLETPIPVTFPAGNYNNPDYGVFISSANGGKGGGNVDVRQRVPVVSGHQYSVRFRYRCEDFQPEEKRSGHPRGYVAFGAWMEWVCPPPNQSERDFFGSHYDSIFDWQTVHDYQRDAISAPYTAPPGAVAADFVLNMRTLAEGHSPKLFIDDVEFVDVTPALVN